MGPRGAAAGFGKDQTRRDTPQKPIEDQQSNGCKGERGHTVAGGQVTANTPGRAVVPEQGNGGHKDQSESQARRRTGDSKRAPPGRRTAIKRAGTKTCH